jgi:hypothetical protein
MRPGWHKHIEDSWFREDMAYAGKDHTKPKNKTFICMGPFEGQERTGFKTLEAAMDKADQLWPPLTETGLEAELIAMEKKERQELGID